MCVMEVYDDMLHTVCVSSDCATYLSILVLKSLGAGPMYMGVRCFVRCTELIIAEK